jgi:hypothetical protein
MPTIKQFAEANRLRIQVDECGDHIIRGSRGILYVDGGKVCAMWIDAPCMRSAKIKALGSTSWAGDKSLQDGRWVQDVKVLDIPPGQWAMAIRMVRARTKRILSEAQIAEAMSHLPAR